MGGRSNVWYSFNSPLSQHHSALLTNLLQFGATTIAAIYKDRWEIELFFKALKQNLKVKSFVGTSLRRGCVTVCLRPFRAAGPRLDVERVGDKAVVHNYGHGGSGWSLSWGSSSIAVEKAMAAGERDVAVIGCGALGLTSAILLQRAGAKVTIYAKERPPEVRSARATGSWTPDSRIAQSCGHYLGVAGTSSETRTEKANLADSADSAPRV
jgi:hypothetical protein